MIVEPSRVRGRAIDRRAPVTRSVMLVCALH
jgi:hypothetical protein